MDITITTRGVAYVALAGVLLAVAIGAEAANDSICKAVPDANRKRFLESGILYQDRVTGAAPWPRAESAGQPQ